jgi:O-methyltransferase
VSLPYAEELREFTAGGQILIHEMLYNDEKTGPFPIAAFSMIMLGWTEGEQYSGKEISEMLREAGFTNIQVRPTATGAS